MGEAWSPKRAGVHGDNEPARSSAAVPAAPGRRDASPTVWFVGGLDLRRMEVDQDHEPEVGVEVTRL
jgi:hypothetical protein